MKEDVKIIKQETYEKPEIEIVEFALEDSIATSGDYGFGAICTE